jgi:hypothetical protein
VQESDIKVGRLYSYGGMGSIIVRVVEFGHSEITGKPNVYFIMLDSGNKLKFGIQHFCEAFKPHFKEVKATKLAKKLHPKAEQEGDFLIVEL